MNRECDKCVYHSSGSCAKWECGGTTTVKDVKSTEYARIIGFLKFNRYAIVDNNGDYYSIEELEEMLKEQTE